MLSEPMENNTFQAQSVRNLWNNNDFNFPGYLLQIPVDPFVLLPPNKKQKTEGYHIIEFFLCFYEGGGKC